MAKNIKDVFEDTKSINIVDDIVATDTNRLLLESSCPFYIVCKSNDLQKSQKGISNLLNISAAIDEVRAMDSQVYAIVGFSLNSKKQSHISKVLLGINRHADIFGDILSVVYNNGKELELILEIAAGQLTQEQSDLAVQLITKLPTDSSTEHHAKDIYNQGHK